MLYAEKVIKSGKMKEGEFYPVLPSGRKLPDGEASGTSESQAKYNKNKTTKQFTRLVNTNFDTGDILLHPTFPDSCAPQTLQEAKKYLNNYLRRVKYYREQHGMPELKYIYVIEKTEYQRGERKGSCNWHFHLFMSGGEGNYRDIVEDMWGQDIRVNADRFQPLRFGQKSAATYMSKAPQGSRSYVCSRNIKKPIVNNGKKDPKYLDISQKKIENMVKLHVDDAAYWQRHYPGYNFIRCETVWNEYNKHWYIRVEMRKPEPVITKKVMKSMAVRS